MERTSPARMGKRRFLFGLIAGCVPSVELTCKAHRGI